VVGERHGDHRLDSDLRHDFGKRRRRSREDDDRLDAVVQVVLELGGRVERIHVHLRGAGAQDTDHRDRQRGNVRQHDRDALAFLKVAPLLQIGGEVAREVIDVGVGNRLVEAAEHGLRGESLQRFFEYLPHRVVCIRIDLVGNVFAVGGAPGLWRTSLSSFS
jgi:hypothetical protein